MLRRTILLHGLALSAQAPQTETYLNQRFGFSVAYPKDLLAPQGEPTNGDGQKFKAKTGKGELSVWSSHNALDQTIPEACQSYIKPPFQPTYKVIKPTWYVFSGLDRGNVIYQKGILQGGIFTTIRFEYPTSEKPTWDPLIAKIVNSLRPGKSD